MSQSNIERALFDVIGCIYDAALEPALWDSVTERVTHLFDGTSMVFFSADVEDSRVGLFSALNHSPERMEDYRSHYVKTDIWLQEAYRARWTPGSVQLTQNYYPERQLLRSEFYNDYLRTIDVHYGCSSILRYDGPEVSATNVLRSRKKGAFGADEADLLARITPHLQRAIELHRRLFEVQRSGSGAMEVLDSLSFGVLLIDAACRVMAMNRAAADIVGAGDGFGIGRGGRCRAGTYGQDATLARLIRKAAETGDGKGMGSGGALALPRPSGLRPYAVLVAPLREGPFELGINRPAAVVFVSDPECRPQPPAEFLARLYGLTPAEARLAAQLLAGASIKEAAEHLQVTERTARWTLGRVFTKTGTRRQSELIRLVLSGPAVLAGRRRPSGRSSSS